MASNNVINAMWNDVDAMTRNRKVGEQMTTPPALKMIEMSGIKDARGPIKVLDNGCGDGIVAQLVWDGLNDALKTNLELVCGDLSPVMVKFASERIEAGGWYSAKALVIDMQDMKDVADSTFTHCFSNFAVQFPPSPEVVLREIKRVCQANAIIGITGWKIVGWTGIVREAIARIPGCPAFPDDETMFAKVQNGNKWQTEQFIQAQLESQGYTDIRIKDIVDEQTLPATVFGTTFGGFVVKAMVALFWSPEAVQEYAGKIEGALLDYLQEQKLEMVTFVNTAMVAVARAPAK